MRKPDFNLYLITDRHQTGRRALTEVVREALQGGVRAVQMREKDLSGAELFRLADKLRRLTSEFKATLIINDRPDIALAVGADGVHIGVSSLPVAAVRRLLGKGLLIGYSAHAIDEALLVQAEGVDFITFGPLYATPSKTIYGSPCGVNALADAVAALGVPVFGLGGISLGNAHEALSTKAHGLAVISAILAAADPCSAAASMLAQIEKYAQHS